MGQADKPMHNVSSREGSEQNACVGQQQQGYGISNQLPQVKFYAAFKEKRRKEQDQNNIWRQPIGPVTRLKRRQERETDCSQKQPAEDEGYRVGNPQAFRQHRGDRGGDEQPNQIFDA
jgi:hypothetical protein